jgi:hypothetical protein
VTADLLLSACPLGGTPSIHTVAKVYSLQFIVAGLATLSGRSMRRRGAFLSLAAGALNILGRCILDPPKLPFQSVREKPCEAQCRMGPDTGWIVAVMRSQVQ